MTRNKFLLPLLGIALMVASTSVSAQALKGTTENYLNNRYPLTVKPYMELPIGSIKPKGMALEMLERQRSGATSQMDKLYPLVMGERNGWLGGDGDQWERGPYWIDGLLPLAYILDDDTLKKKVQPWIEWALNSQREDGFFGPAKDYSYEPGVQRDNSADWWPRMVVLKILKQYYMATQDPRIIPFMTNYFRYQLNTLPTKPLGNWTFWAEYRACDNLHIVYWLYNMTGEKFLLDLGNIIHKQSYNFTDVFLTGDEMSRPYTIHCVNLAQGLKEPIIYYQQDKDQKYIDAVKKGLADIRKYHGQPQGMYGGDEALHGNNPTQGSELCAAAELMLSLEQMLEITGDVQFADHLEKITFNALPTQTSDDYMERQYFQQPNQVTATRATRFFDCNHDGTDVVYGLLTGYPCCTSNMHQAWPKFVQNLWYASHDNGLAALVYSASEVNAKVANGVGIKMVETTNYPMDGNVRFDLTITQKGVKEVAFPFHVRIPSWCKEATIKVNGAEYAKVKGGQITQIDRTWKSGDNVELSFPMNIKIEQYYERAVAVERGPLVYALKVEGKKDKKIVPEKERHDFGEYYYEITPTTPWNYALSNIKRGNLDECFTVEVDQTKVDGNFPWNLENAPIKLKTKGRQVLGWDIYRNSAGQVPFSAGHNSIGEMGEETEITLVPYGCTELRISEFPVVYK